MAVSYEPVRFVKTLGQSGMPSSPRGLEAASQTFKIGAPLTLSSGYLQEAAFGGSELVYGVAIEQGHNLSAAGTAQEYSEAAPQNQPNAKITPIGSWIRDGHVSVIAANGVNVFSAMLKDGQVFSQALVSSVRYALVKDGSSGFWYIDNTSNGTNDEHCVNIIALDSSSPNSATLGAKVWFVFAAAARYFD